MNYRPGVNRILVERTDRNQMTPGGLAIPDTCQDRGIRTGKIVGIGICEEQIPAMGLKVGLEVKYHTGVPIDLDGEDYEVVNVPQIECLKD